MPAAPRAHPLRGDGLGTHPGATVSETEQTTTNNRQQQQTTNNNQQATSNKQQATNNKQQQTQKLACCPFLWMTSFC